MSSASSLFCAPCLFAGVVRDDLSRVVIKCLVINQRGKFNDKKLQKKLIWRVDELVKCSLVRGWGGTSRRDGCGSKQRLKVNKEGESGLFLHVSWHRLVSSSVHTSRQLTDTFLQTWKQLIGQVRWMKSVSIKHSSDSQKTKKSPQTSVNIRLFCPKRRTVVHSHTDAQGHFLMQPRGIEPATLR